MSSIWPHIHVHILMGVIVLGRVFCLSLTFAMYRVYALFPLGLYFLIIFAYALWTNKKNQDMVDTFKVFLATFTSMFAPCMIMIDNSMYYFVNATIGNLFYALSIWPLFWIMTLIRKFYIQESLKKFWNTLDALLHYRGTYSYGTSNYFWVCCIFIQSDFIYKM